MHMHKEEPMKRIVSTLMMASAALAVGLALMPITAAAKKPSPYVTVNCDAGQSIQAAIDRANPSIPLTLTVVGTCEESVRIERDDVVIDGQSSAVVYGGFAVYSSNRVKFHNITVTGPGHAVSASGSSVTLYNVTAAGNEESWAAVVANANSAMGVYHSDITGNDASGVAAGLNSSLVIGESVIDDNVRGVHLTDISSAYIVDDTKIQGNDTGIWAHNHSLVDLVDTDVSGNSLYGIQLAQDAAATLRTGNTVSGNGIAGVFCSDTESSFSNQGEPLDDPVNCTGF